jgi:hypothetical protein
MSIAERKGIERMFGHSARFAYVAGTLFGTFIVAPIFANFAYSYEEYIAFTAPHRWPIKNDPEKIRYYKAMKELDEIVQQFEEEQAAEKRPLA